MVQTVKVADQREFTNVLYYGDGGSGKTSALAALANEGRVLYVDAEAGIKRRPLESLGIEVGNIELLDARELDFPTLDELHESVRRDLDDDPDSWAGVIWDSGTEIYQALVTESVSTRVGKRKARGDTGQMADQFFIDRDDWGRANGEYRQLMRRFRDLPCHFGSAFLPRRDQDQQTGHVHVGPSISPGLQSDVIGWHDIACHTTYDDARDLYLGQFKPHGVYQGKDRYGALPEIMVDPTFERILAYVQGDLVAEDDPRQLGLDKQEAVEVVKPKRPARAAS